MPDGPAALCKRSLPARALRPNALAVANARPGLLLCCLIVFPAPPVQRPACACSDSAAGLASFPPATGAYHGLEHPDPGQELG